MEVLATANFSRWLKKLRDHIGKGLILAKIREIQETGNIPADSKPLGDGISEMRFHSGPGYRIYFTVRGNEIVVLLAGGNKTSQPRDIKTAKQIAKQLGEKQ